MDGLITDKQLVIEFCELHLDLFAGWIEEEHDIDPAEAGVILADLRKEAR